MPSLGRAFLAPLMLHLLLPGPTPAQDPLAICLEESGARRGHCLYTVAREHGLWEEGKRRLRTLVEDDPSDAYALFNLARLELDRGVCNSAAELFARAAEGFAERGAGLDEAYARINRTECLRIAGELSTAAEEAGHAADLARAVDQAELEAHARLVAVRIARARGEELEGLRLHLLAMESRIFAEDADPVIGYGVRKTWLFELGGVLLDLYRLDEALAVNRRWAELAHREGDAYGEATAWINMATCASEMSWREDAAGEALRLAEEGLALAEATGQRFAELEALRLLGKILPGEAGRDHLRRCLELAPPGSRGGSLCHFALAASWTADDPTRARHVLDQALSTAATAEDPWRGIYSWADQFQVFWSPAGEDAEDGDRLRALEVSLEVLDRLESLRRQQSLDGRADVFAAVVQVYHALTGYLLTGPAEPGRLELEAAFAISERMRGRVLLDRLRLGSDTHHSASELDAFTSLEELGESLGDDEAFFVFQVAPERDAFGRPGGGSWLMVICRGTTRLYRLPDGPELEKKVGLLLGLLEEGAGQDPIVEEVAGVLYRILLKEAVTHLPAGVEHWILAPDGLLNLLPFGLLAPEAELSTVPSATLWRPWRESPPPLTSAALAFADPTVPAVDTPVEGTGPTRRSEDLRRLPYARREGRRLVHRLGGASRLLVDEQASEGALEEQDLGQYGILHFATHALLDARQPDNSKVILAPDPGGDDGFLHPHEIVDLELGGQLVVLSACQSAAGKQRLGEGVDSLARAFILAGARTVVASPWRLRDDEAADFFETFYSHLANGGTVSSAMAATRIQLRSAGARPAAWAGVKVLGDGDWAPVHPAPRSTPPRWTAVATLGLLTLLLAFGILRRRGGHPPAAR